MNKKISLSFIAVLCVAVASMSFYSVNNFTAISKSATVNPANGDEQAILDYAQKNNLKVQKTASGLYYVIKKHGIGPKVTKGSKVTVNYTGTLLDGTKFDSSTDPSFGHVQPLPLTVGIGQVIKGWDEGLQLFNVGGSGKLLIPSALAYGPQANGKIPANAVLVFDVEIVSLQ